jgi:hypothetical protein
VPLPKKVVRLVACDTDLWFDDVWVTDSTPVECGRSRLTAKRSELAGWAAELDRWPADRGIRLLRPPYRNGTPHPAQHLLKPVRQLIESVNDTLKGQLDLELHGGRSIEGVTARVAQRILALTAAIWHNRTTGQPVTRTMTA